MDIDRTSTHYKGAFVNIYEVNKKYPNGGTDGDYVEIDGWAHYWNADRGTWCVNEKRDEYWDEVLSDMTHHVTSLENTISSERDARTAADTALSQAIGSLPKQVNCTEAEYDALVSSGKVDSNTYYNIYEE